MNVPYDKLSLQVAMLSAGNKLVAYEAANGEGSLEAKITALGLQSPPSGAELNAQTAAHHGITVPELIGSPNYARLKEEYGEHMTLKVIDAMKDAFGLEDKEAWAVATSSQL